MQLFWFVLLPIIIALIGYMSHHRHARFVVILSQILYLSMAFYVFFYVKYHGEIFQVLGNYPRGLGIALRADTISSVFLLLTNFLFAIMLLFNYHKAYMDHLFLFLFMTLQGLINGIFLSDDLFNLYVLIEVSTIVVSILIMFKRDGRSIYDGLVYLLTNIVSMTLFLLGVGYIYYIFGTEDLTLIKESLPLLENKETLLIPYCLFITTACLKSAIMPLFSWLPKAHGTPSAPSIVSAILSGLYVKSGLYLFLRIQDVFGDFLQTDEIFLVMGVITAILGFLFAFSQTDIKLLLAYSTISQIGLIIFGLSMGSNYSYYGSIYHILNHAIFKSTLFLTAGILIEEYETRDLRKIHGVYKRSPFLSTIIVVCILGMTGAPLFNGSISKYLIEKGTYHHDTLEYLLIFINLGTIMTFVKYATILFGSSKKIITLRWNQKISLSIMAVFCFFGGIFGMFFVEFLFDIHISISFWGYIEKIGIYLASILISLFFYRYIYPKLSIFHKIQEFELTFNQIVISIVLFFSTLLGYMLYFIRA